MSAFQVCARCGTRWPVNGRASVWCPRCHGVLLSPVAAQAPAQGRRNFRWTARPPRGPVRKVRRAPAATPTPSYDAVPQWGLHDVPLSAAGDDAPGPVERNARVAAGLIVITGALLLLGAAAELFRYGILLYNRTRLVDPTVLMISDALVFFATIGALVIGLGAIIAAACWLVHTRRLAFAAAGTVEPRRTRLMIALTVLPIVRMLMPGIYLTELISLRVDARSGELRRLVRIWWVVWVLGNLFVLLQIIFRNPGSLQGKADGVLWAAFVSLFGAVVAVTTLVLMRRIEDRNLRGSTRKAPTRWVVAVPNRAGPNRAAAAPEGATEPESAGVAESEDAAEPESTPAEIDAQVAAR